MRKIVHLDMYAFYASVEQRDPVQLRGVPVFFFTDTAPTEIYTLSLHDALPICPDAAPHTAPERRAGRSSGSGVGPWRAPRAHPLPTGPARAEPGGAPRRTPWSRSRAPRLFPLGARGEHAAPAAPPCS